MGEMWVYMNGHITDVIVNDGGGGGGVGPCVYTADHGRFLRSRKPSEDREVQRLAQYEQYFQSILCDGHHNHPDHEDITRARAKAKQAVIRSQEESDLERIQDLFPNDCLRLYDKDVLTMKMKGLIRKRSTTAARLQRALSAKSLRPEDDESPGRLEKSNQDKRQFLMEAPVQFTTGVQSQERHLFLFTDLLLVAKARSGGNFKLKEKVRVSELWLTRCAMDDVIEVNKAIETSFVIGWPTTNVVATFGTQAARDLWWNKLSEVVSVEKEKEPRSTNIQVVYYDLSTNIEYCKTFSVGPDETARCCIRLALEHLDLRTKDSEAFQLWARTSREEAPYPLIGHERPFAIKLSALRHGLSSEEGFDLDHCNNVHGPDPLPKCQFILRSKRKCSDCPQGLESSGKKSSKKSRKSPMKIREVFRRSLSNKECAAGQLFGRALPTLCHGDALPKPVMSMLQEVFAKGPQTQGIFRKSANARLVRELRDQLDVGEDLTMECFPVLVTASLLKDFLRSLPDPLLGSALYPLWMEALECTDEDEKLARIKSVLDQLPRVNVNLLCHFLCVLHHVARRSSHNLMSAGNLGVCVGPSLLWAPGPSQAALSRAVPTLIELLITRCELLCGPHVPHLLGDPADAPRQDSGAEESDSLHSGGLRRDDSSIDSLERELLEPPRKDKMSLSRDSGLTLSDSQLYTPDEEESGSTSSGSLYPPTNTHAKVSSSYSMPVANSTPTSTTQPMREYVRVYGGWEERVQECCNRGAEDSIYPRHRNVVNPNFQRRDWFRQRSHLKRVNSGGTGSSKSSHQMSGSSSGSSSSGVGGLHRVYAPSNGTMLRRSASEESMLDNDRDYEEDNGNPSIKRPALHSKGRAPPPPPTAYSPDAAHDRFTAPLPRSKSAHHLACAYVTPEEKTPPRMAQTPAPDPRWRSTPHIAAPDETERSYDSSTLSDDDSTPHVSRSNSRGKDCAAANSAWESVYGPSTELIVHAAPVNIREEEGSEGLAPLPVSRKGVDATESSAPPLPPKRSPTDVKLRHLPPVHVETAQTRPSTRPQSCYVSTETARQWEEMDGETRKAPERRGRLRRRDDSCARAARSKSLPPPPGSEAETANAWSVSQLTTLFGGSRPPPYRPPPRVIPSHRAPITAFHLGANSPSERYVASQRLLLQESADEEESYV